MYAVSPDDVLAKRLTNTGAQIFNPLRPIVAIWVYIYKASSARPLTLRVERQSAWMSKITNCGLTRPGRGYFIAVSIYDTSGCQRVKGEFARCFLWCSFY